MGRHRLYKKKSFPIHFSGNWGVAVVFIYLDIDKQYRNTINELLHLYFPGYKQMDDERSADVVLCIKVKKTFDGPEVRAELSDNSQHLERSIKLPWLGDTDPVNETKRTVRLAILQLLETAAGETKGYWGTLTSVRPTKVVNRMLDQGWDKTKVKKVLQDHYALRHDKVQLLLDVTDSQRTILKNSSNNCINLYIGIPFCPSRCTYCSFPAVAVGSHAKLVEPYLTALCEEIKSTLKAVHEHGLKVRTIYIGGGTPTVLSVGQLDRLLNTIDYPLNADVEEYTVEAGRPDTLEKTKLKLLKSGGVDRISINPQTFWGETLEKIDRRHTVEEFIKAYSSTQELNFDIINTDLIIGLPGENIDTVKYTLDRLENLHPDNITVHTLALKKASKIQQSKDRQLVDNKEIDQMVSFARRRIQEMGQQPYYMYRQKNTLGQLENVGYSLPGKEGLYNILMIEERETVIGLGVGSGSKWVLDQELHNVTYNPKDITVYMERLPLLIREKIDKIAFLGGMIDADKETQRH